LGTFAPKNKILAKREVFFLYRERDRLSGCPRATGDVKELMYVSL